MKQQINVRIADPSGNTTIFVLDRTDRRDYAAVAKALLIKRYYAEGRELIPEQVAFVTGPASMEMCGLEFCGNATRAFALMCAEAGQYRLPDGSGVVRVQVSGAEEPLDVTVTLETGYTSVRMPDHQEVSEFEGGTLVRYDGIVHLILDDIPSDERFEELREMIATALDPPAIGVMFCPEEAVEVSHFRFDLPEDVSGAETVYMAPVVYVRDVNTVYHEGSCASGTTAVAVARSCGKPDGKYQYDVCQPAGTLTATATVDGGAVTSVWIEGEVRLYEPTTVDIDW